MAFYEYVCPAGHIYETQTFAHIGDTLMLERCDCGDVVTRMVSLPQTRPSAEPYFNANVGTWVKDDKHFQQVLNEKAAKNSQLTGMDHNYVPVYPGDLSDPGTMKKLGVGAGADRGESIEHSRRTNPGSRPKSTKTIIT